MFDGTALPSAPQSSVLSVNGSVSPCDYTAFHFAGLRFREDFRRSATENVLI